MSSVRLRGSLLAGAERRSDGCDAAGDGTSNFDAIVPSTSGQIQISRYAVAQLQANAQLATEQAQQVSPDVTRSYAFVRALGLAAAVSEATMPDRTISELSATLQTYLTLGSSPDGSTSVGCGSTSRSLARRRQRRPSRLRLQKSRLLPGSSAPPNLYSVMSAKQAVFSLLFSSCSVPVRRSGRHRSHERARRGIVVDVSLSDSRKARRLPGSKRRSPPPWSNRWATASRKPMKPR